MDPRKIKELISLVFLEVAEIALVAAVSYSRTVPRTAFFVPAKFTYIKPGWSCTVSVTLCHFVNYGGKFP